MPHLGLETRIVLAGQSSVPADHGDPSTVTDPHLLGGPIDHPEDMELVGHNPSPGKNLFDRFPVRPEKVDHHRLDRPLPNLR
jgi:hypothetical protein